MIKGKHRRIIVFGCLIASMLAVFVSLAGCKKKDSPPPKPTAIPIPTAEPVNMRDISGDTPMASSVIYADQMANGVTVKYTDPYRNGIHMKNDTIQIEHTLTGDDKNVVYVKDFVGNTLLDSGIDLFAKDSGGKYQYDRYSSPNGRVNTTRLGYYYYETHVRDQIFGIEQSEVEYQNRKEISLTDGKWNVNMMSAPVVKNGTLEVTVLDSTDPYLYRNVSVSQNDCNAILLTMKIEGMTNIANMFFYTSDRSSFNADQMLQFTVIPDGEYHTYVISLQGNETYKADLRGVRFDLGNTGEKITIKKLEAVKLADETLPFMIDKTFHLYSDKVHQEYRIVATADIEDVKAVMPEFGVEIKILKSRVSSYQVDKEAGYAAFDITFSGILGFIIPNDGSTSDFTVTEEGDYYVFRQYAEYSGKIKSGKDIKFGNRLYNDFTHDFEGIKKAAYIERNPLEGIKIVKSAAAGKYLGYDPLRGMYHFTHSGMQFAEAYKQYKNKYYYSDIQIIGDSYDRNIYLWINGKSGCVESSVVLDENEIALPISVQVCKNFGHEKEEKVYDPNDTIYGDSIIPLNIGAGQTYEFSAMQLYQNWGVFPLKQISSIQFHISYYHLSTGVTESNCIAPYFVYGKDRWTLPDFRGCSGIIWSDQPQYNAVGRLRFLSYTDKNDKIYASEYTDAHIESSGPVYADMDYSYISDCGSFEYTLRHFEFPQTDENRTYYTIELNVLKDLTVENPRENFTLFDMDGRAAAFSMTSYMDVDGKKIVKTMDLSKNFSEINVLNKDVAYFSYYGITGDQADTIMNFAFIIKDHDITINGQKWDGNFVFRNSFSGTLNNGAISFDMDTLKLKAGDSIKINLILLPWGDHLDKEDPNVDYVIEDSVLNPLSITAAVGTVIEDDYLPRVMCEDNKAEFSISGGRNNNAVRVDGFTVLGRPKIFILEESGEWSEYKYDAKEYDGYQVNFNKDGTYSYSFVFNKDLEEVVTFKIEF